MGLIRVAFDVATSVRSEMALVGVVIVLSVVLVGVVIVLGVVLMGVVIVLGVVWDVAALVGTGDVWPIGKVSTIAATMVTAVMPFALVATEVVATECVVCDDRSVTESVTAMSL